ncbi:MAG TPA: response regulator [Burkholderiales bacterium]|nr:response regulator [Burkholderiales bacterium]
MDTFELVEILLVEDNPHDAEFMTRALREGGFANRLHWVKDGQEALDFLLRDNAYAGRAYGMPRLIFLDLKMPRVGGIELLQRIKADGRTRHIPVVILTSSSEEIDVMRSYDLGVNSYVVKPMDLAELMQVARQAGYYWLAINRLPGEE